MRISQTVVAGVAAATALTVSVAGCAGKSTAPSSNVGIGQHGHE